MQIIAVIGWLMFAAIVIPMVIAMIAAIPDMIRYMQMRRM
jgi:hypothetical protein